MKKEYLYNWVFYFNPYEQLWFAFKREDYSEFFNNRQKIKHVQAKDVDGLIDIIKLINE